jgi:hypothetical protein
MKLALGQTTRLHVSKMPFTLTWTSKDLYFSCSGKSLQVYRIPLFSTAEEKAEEDLQPVWTPRKPFFLPYSASNRAVYYFPPTENKSGKEQLPARILIRSDFTALKDIEPNEAEEEYDVLLVKRFNECSVRRRGEFQPPIGCYVDEDTNLGGWVDSHARANILQDRGVGRLDPRMPVEHFNPDDDCDCECYCQTTCMVPYNVHSQWNRSSIDYTSRTGNESSTYNIGTSFRIHVLTQALYVKHADSFS